jgi:hypothetical protein
MSALDLPEPVAESLHLPLDADALAALPADERFDDSVAGEGVHASAMRTAGAANLHGCEFHQSGADAIDGNCIDHGAARVAHEVCHVAVFLDHEAAVAIRTRGKFVRDGQVTAFVLGHIG